MPDWDDPVWACRRKHAYGTKHKAREIALRAFRLRGVRLRSYQCELCAQYHLTKDNA